MVLSALILFAAIESTCVPINADMFWVKLPDGTSDSFVRSVDDPNALVGAFPWIGVLRPENRMVNILTQPSYNGVQRQYCYIDGHLRFASENGKDRAIDPASHPKPRGCIRGFWPTQADYDEWRAKNDMWKGANRLRFISQNPNRTALILAQLTLVSLCVLLFSRTAIWRWHGALWTLIFLLLQFQSLSRGGMLAFFAGAFVAVYFRWRRKWKVKSILLVLSCGCLLAGASLFVFRNRLMTQTSADSSQSRIAIWREVPRMIAAAPFGWGLWKSGPAYNGWFEKPERRHMIGDLFNDHLSRFVEGGFLFGGLYVFVWCFLLVAGLRWSSRGHSPAFLTVWLAYFIAACFNPMVYWGKSFALPGAVSVVWLVQVARACDKRRILSPLLPLGVTACVLMAFAAVAACAPEQDIPLRVSMLGRQVIAGKGDPQVWVADDGFVLNGNFNGYPGREIRQHYQRHPNAEALGLVERVRDLPDTMDRLVLTGTCGEDYLEMDNPPKAKHLVFLTPPFSSDKIPPKLRESCDVHLVTGEFAAALTGDDLKDEDWIHVISGARVYVPGWLGVVVKDKSHDS